MVATRMSRELPNVAGRGRIRTGRIALQGFLIAISLLWLFPLAWAIYTSLRPYADTALRGYVSLPATQAQLSAQISGPLADQLRRHSEAAFIQVMS